MLQIVATPIGNLEDISFRAVNCLKKVDFIICEDTRVSGMLLKNFDISKELISFNAQSESRKIPRIVERLSKGDSAALISDAGTPAISDPGVRLVNECVKNGIKVSGVPGANAAVLALSISGLPTDSFVFEGFLPQKKGRQKLLQSLAQERRTIVLYESVYRIEKLMSELTKYMPERYTVVWRELTKKFEESWRGFPKEILSELDEKIIKGEFVVVIAPLNWKVKEN